VAREVGCCAHVRQTGRNCTGRRRPQSRSERRIALIGGTTEATRASGGRLLGLACRQAPTMGVRRGLAGPSWEANLRRQDVCSNGPTRARHLQPRASSCRAGTAASRGAPENGCLSRESEYCPLHTTAPHCNIGGRQRWFQRFLGRGSIGTNGSCLRGLTQMGAAWYNTNVIRGTVLNGE